MCHHAHILLSTVFKVRKVLIFHLILFSFWQRPEARVPDCTGTCRRTSRIPCSRNKPATCGSYPILWIFFKFHCYLQNSCQKKKSFSNFLWIINKLFFFKSSLSNLFYYYLMLNILHSCYVFPENGQHTGCGCWRGPNCPGN